ncbi:MAG: hypothetical protein HEQ23_09015 [Tepidisphaera sp.]
MTGSPNHLHPRLTPERFYWSVLTPSPDLAVVTARSLGTSMTRAVLGEAFAAHLPVELATVAPAYKMLADGSVLACALPAAALGEPDLASAITVAPSALPEWLTQDADPESLNVLTGAFEPRAVLAARRHRSLAVAGLAAMVAFGCVVGFERRAAHARGAERASVAALDELVRSQPAQDLGIRPDQPAHERSVTLDRELSRLRATRNSQASLGLADAADPLASVLAAWPRGTKAQVQSISAAPSQLSLSALLPTLPEAEKLASALGSAPGWAPAQPQITTSGKGVQMQLTLTPTSPNSKPQGGTP